MRTEPNHEILIFTHHSPTTLEAATDPRHRIDPAQVSSGFATDLSGEVCWVAHKLGFGHLGILTLIAI